MKIFNKKAKFNYKLLDRFEAGIALLGAEVKAIRRGMVDLSHSFAKVVCLRLVYKIWVTSRVSIDYRNRPVSSALRCYFSHQSLSIFVPSGLYTFRLQ